MKNMALDKIQFLYINIIYIFQKKKEKVMPSMELEAKWSVHHESAPPTSSVASKSKVGKPIKKRGEWARKGSGADVKESVHSDSEIPEEQTAL